tara:strand:+ start:8618 stop:9148 length:531 start_codon:yes stop_codon:yes gene_type:complete
MAKSSFFSSNGISPTNTTALQSSVATAANSATNAINAFNKFDSRYLGSFALPPDTDNQSAALQEGALYYDTRTKLLYVWRATYWESIGDYSLLLRKANNLSDLASLETARKNLSLGDSTLDTYYVKSRASSGTAINVEGTIRASGSVDATTYKREGTVFLDNIGQLTNVTLDAGNF